MRPSAAPTLALDEAATRTGGGSAPRCGRAAARLRVAGRARSPSSTPSKPPGRRSAPFPHRPRAKNRPRWQVLTVWGRSTRQDGRPGKRNSAARSHGQAKRKTGPAAAKRAAGSATPNRQNLPARAVFRAQGLGGHQERYQNTASRWEPGLSRRRSERPGPSRGSIARVASRVRRPRHRTPPAPQAPRARRARARGACGAEFANSPKLAFPQMQKGQPRTTDLQVLVGLTGFEPAASASRTQRSTKLSHNPKYCFKQRRI